MRVFRTTLSALRLLLCAALAGCSAPSASQKLNDSDLEGAWSLVVRDLPARGGANAQTEPPDTFTLDVAVSDGRIAGCKLNPGARDDQCTVRDGLFYVETSDPGSPALVFALKRLTATRFEGGAALDLPQFGRQTIGSVVMTKVS